MTVGVLGSFADGGRGDLKRFLCAWSTEHPGIETEIEIDDLRAVTVLPIPLPKVEINDAHAPVVRSYLAWPKTR